MATSEKKEQKEEEYEVSNRENIIWMSILDDEK